MRISAFALIASLALTASPALSAQTTNGANATNPTAAPAARSSSQSMGKFSPKSLSRVQIMKIQKGLDKAGFNAGRADGKWGAKTQKAGMAFLKSKHKSSVSQLTDKDLADLGLNRAMFASRHGSAKIYGSAPRRPASKRPTSQPSSSQGPASKAQ
jgi:peptidoglycan hydrolase-like protein with peptidoglycan-binding domain